MEVYGTIKLVVSLPGGFPRKGVNVISTYEILSIILGALTLGYNVIKDICKKDDTNDTKKTTT